jgi:uncharacterized protein involved in outer membrane biogenesis
MRLGRILFVLAALAAAVAVAVYATLSSLSFEDLRDLAQSEAKSLTGRELVIAGPIDLKISLKPEIVLEDVTFANASWGSRPAMIELKRFELQVALWPLLTGDIQVQRLTLIEPDILLETDESGRGNWAIGEDGGASGGGAPNLPTFAQAEIEGGSLTYRDGASGDTLSLDLTRLQAQAGDRPELRQLELEGRYGGAPFSLAGSAGSLKTFYAGHFPVEFTGTAGGAKFQVSGTIEQPAIGQGLDLKVSAKGQSLAGLSPFVGQELPALGPYDVSAHLVMAGETLELTGLSVALGGSDLAGALTVALTDPRPKIEGAFSANLLDLADFQAKDVSAGRQGGDFVFTEDPIDLAGLRAVDGRVALKAGRLRVEPRLELSDLDLSLDLTDGRLTLAPLTAGLAGGTLRVEAEVDGAKETPRVTAKVQASDLDYGDLMTRYEVTDKLSGTLDLNLDLQGQGNSARAIASTLNGQSEVISDGGRFDNTLLKVLGTGLSDILGPLLGGGGDQARLNCLVSRFQIHDGLATSRAMILDSESLTVAGGGTIDLKTERLDLQLDTSTRTPSLASLAVPFDVTGTLASPQFLPDPVAAATGVANSAVSLVGTTVDELGALLGQSTSASGNAENACLAALAAAEESGKSVIDQAGEVVEDAAKGVAKGVEGAAKGVTDAIKNLFGN